MPMGRSYLLLKGGIRMVNVGIFKKFQSQEDVNTDISSIDTWYEEHEMRRNTRQ